MELKGSKTEANLLAAFAGESQARNKYTYYASQARKDGYEQIAAIFEETANNEKEHAKLWFKELNGGKVPNTLENLKVDYVHVLVNGKIVKTGDASLAEEIEREGYEKYKKVEE